LIGRENDARALHVSSCRTLRIDSDAAGGAR
jgi:hypothetical protein